MLYDQATSTVISGRRSKRRGRRTKNPQKQEQGIKEEHYDSETKRKQSLLPCTAKQPPLCAYRCTLTWRHVSSSQQRDCPPPGPWSSSRPCSTHGWHAVAQAAASHAGLQLSVNSWHLLARLLRCGSLHVCMMYWPAEQKRCSI